MSKLADLQNSIITQLTAVNAAMPAPVPANGQIQWITENIGDLANVIARTTGKLGIIGIVMTPGGKLVTPGSGPPIAIHSLVEIQIQENVTINRGASGTQISAIDLVEFCMKRLQYFERDQQRIRRIVLDEIPFLLVSEYPILTYNVRLNAPLTIQ
jgi:hypothetical protein